MAGREKGSELVRKTYWEEKRGMYWEGKQSEGQRKWILSSFGRGGKQTGGKRRCFLFVLTEKGSRVRGW